jgi:hypothetical protein
MRLISYSSFVLLLSEIPLSGQCLFLSILHQLQLQSHDYSLPPEKHLKQLRLAAHHEIRCNLSDYNSFLLARAQALNLPPSQRLMSFLVESLLNPETIGGLEVIRALNLVYGWGFDIYRQHEGILSYLPAAYGLPTIRLYYSPPYFDSVVQVTRQIIPSIPCATTVPSFTIATYNLRGVADPTQQIMLDDLCFKLKIDILCVQESHLRTHRFDSKSYAWIMGPQTANRASRGVGFLVRKQLMPLCTSFKFPTINIGELCIKDPSLKRAVVVLSLHKLSDGDSRSSLETGN